VATQGFQAKDDNDDDDADNKDDITVWGLILPHRMQLIRFVTITIWTLSIVLSFI
jgi:hypothetical protein